MKIHCTKQFLRAAALLAAIIYGGDILAQAQSCSVTWTGNARSVQSCSWSMAGNWSPRKVPGPTSDVCIPILTTADATATPSISVHSIQVAEGGSLLFGSGKVSIATSLILKLLDRHHEALFVGQWAPTILILGLYNKLVKQHGSDQFDT